MGRPSYVHGKAVTGPADLPGFLVGGRTSREDQVGDDPLLGCVDADPVDPERLYDLDSNGPDARFAAVEWESPGREHRSLDAAVDGREGGVDDVTVRVGAEGHREVQVVAVAVKPEAVVVVRMPAAGVGEREGGLVDRIVVKRGQHAFTLPHRVRYAVTSAGWATTITIA